MFVIENFLDEIENIHLLDWAQNNQKKFIPSTVSTGVDDFRKSVVAFEFPLMTSIKSRLIPIIPTAMNVIGVEIAYLGEIEAQMTATSNGGFFKRHTDRGIATPNRKISYVYFLNSSPKPFTGGELRLYEGNESIKVNQIEPTNNTLILFHADCWHEVMPVQCSDFADSRFTVNGWINEKKLA